MQSAIYTRLSRDDLGDGQGVKRQDEDCTALASRRDWTVTRRYCDNDISAFSGRRRPAYEDLIADITAGRVQAVLAWAPERLHRSPRELEDFLELIERHKVTVETVKAGTWDVSTSHGRLVARMLGAVSRAESERTGERVSRAHQQAKAEGRWRGPIPFGMAASDQPGLPGIEPAEAEVVRDVYRRILRGDALTRIAADLNRQGSRPRRGQAWTHTGVLRMVSSPALGGLIAIDGEHQKAAFKGVVDGTTWRSAQAELAGRPKGESRRPREKLTLLGGILRCAEHGYICMGGGATHGPTYTASGPGQCYVSITRAVADELVTTVILKRLSMPDAAALFVPAVNPEMHRQRQELQARRDEIAGLLGEGLLSGAAARAELTKIVEQLDRLTPTSSGRPVSSGELTAAPMRTWASLTQPQRRSIVQSLFDRVEVNHVGHRAGPKADPRRISISWRTVKSP